MLSDLQVTDTKKEIEIVRMLNAPVAAVFSAWTNPKKLQQWYAPDNCTLVIKKLDVREGGSFLYSIKNPSYPDCWSKGVYLEVSAGSGEMAPARIVFSMVSSNENGEDLASRDDFLHPEWPRETIVTITLEDISGKTKLTLKQTASEALAKKTGAYPSWLQMLDRLAIVTAY